MSEPTWNCHVTMPSAAKPWMSTTTGLFGSGGAVVVLSFLDLLRVLVGTQKFMTVPGFISTLWVVTPAIFMSQFISGFCAATKFTIFSLSLSMVCMGVIGLGNDKGSEGI